MKPDITRQSLASTLILFGLLLGLFWCRAVSAPFPAETPQGMQPLLGGTVNGWLGAVPWMRPALYLSLVFICAMRVMRIVSGNMLLVTRTFLPAIFFLLIGMGFYVTPSDVRGVMCAWLFIEGSHFTISGFRRAWSFDALFRGGMLFGFMPLVLPDSAAMWLCLPVGLRLFRRSGGEAVTAVAGLLLPLASWSYAEWMTGGEFTRAAMEIWRALVAQGPLAFAGTDVFRIAAAGLTVILLLLSVFSFAAMARSMRTRPARIVGYFIFSTVVAGAMLALPCRSALPFPLIAAGGAVVAPVFFVRRTGAAPAAFYWLIVVALAAANVIPMI